MLTAPLPSPAEKGDREAVDEESICKPTYRDYSYAPTTMRIEVLKQLIQLLVFWGAEIQKAVGKLATHPERWFYKCSPHPPLRGPPSPLGKAEERTDKSQFTQESPKDSP